MAGVVAVGVALPWHLAMWHRHGGAFTEVYFGAQVAERAAGGHAGVASPQQPVWFYAEQVLTTYWPWLVCVVLALVTLARGLPIDRDGRAWRLAVVWAVGWLVLLTVFPDRRDRYALVVWPAMAVLAGLWLSRWPWAWLRRVERGVARWGVVGAAVVFAVVQASPVRLFAARDAQWDWLAERLDDAGVVPVAHGGMDPSRRARLYLERGVWLETPEEVRARVVAGPLLVVYHRRDGLAPGAGERVLATRGDLTIAEFVGEDWSPVAVEDPGERGE